MRKTCGNDVYETSRNLGTTCESLSTHGTLSYKSTKSSRGNVLLIRTKVDVFCTIISTVFRRLLYLLNTDLCTLSPAPITSTTKRKERNN